jgi:hypothetical protein
MMDPASLVRLPRISNFLAAALFLDFPYACPCSNQAVPPLASLVVRLQPLWIQWVICIKSWHLLKVKANAISHALDFTFIIKQMLPNFPANAIFF